MAALLAVGILSALFANRGPAATLQTDFDDRMVASVDSPIALAFTPDTRILVATQSGQMRVYKSGQLLQTPALDLSGKICQSYSQGLLGVTVDPNFAANHYVYLFYTYNKFGSCPLDEPANPNNPVNRVSRFVMTGDTLDPASEVVLIDNIPSHGSHNAGDVHFGKDGYLYVSTGDGVCDYALDSGCAGQNDAARDRNVLLGKILRITRNGSIPATNPFTGADSGRCNRNGRTDPGKNCQETFASGLRQPFRFAFDPDASGTRFFINEVGQARWEEVDEGKAGADYAWNLCEGNHDNPDRGGSVNCAAAPYTPPIYEYSHGTGCSTITGGAFVPNGLWPARYDNSYLIGDYVCGKIFELTPKEGGGFTRTEFASDLGKGGPIAMSFGPHGSSQALYYTTYANGGEVHRITYAQGANRAPHAAVSASPSSGDVPLEVSFDGSDSNDPDFGDEVASYLWNFGDGSPAVETTTSIADHTYTQAGTYTATLTVRDKSGADDTATVRVDAGNRPPEPTISSPTQDQLFKVGEKIVLRGSATDPQDGQLADGALSWQVFQHHAGDHTHPFLPPTPGNDVEIVAPAPEDIHSTDPEGNYLEVRLTATDSKGLSRTVTQKLAPNTVDVVFQSRPGELDLFINGHKFDDAMRTFVSWEGYRLNVYAPSPQTSPAGVTYSFASWSDGKEQQHDIVTGATPSSYTATFKACTKTGTSAGETLEGTSGADVICGFGGNDTVRAKGSNDIIEGMGSNDVLYGGGGADKVRGGGGGDGLYGEAGNDTLDSRDGVSGNDSLDGGTGTDTKVTDTSEKSIVGFP
jgi:glucose/arabinose dehydrogenase/PKD repeat protein